MTTLLATVVISAVEVDTNNEASSLFSISESLLPESSQIDDESNEDGFFIDVIHEVGNFFNNIFGEDSYISQYASSSPAEQQQASDTPTANIKRAIFDMNGFYEDDIVPDPSSNEYFDSAIEATTEAALLQEQKEKMAFNLAMTFKNAARKKALSGGMPSSISRLLEKRGYYKSHKRFTRSVKNLPIED